MWIWWYAEYIVYFDSSIDMGNGRREWNLIQTILISNLIPYVWFIGMDLLVACIKIGISHYLRLSETAFLAVSVHVCKKQTNKKIFRLDWTKKSKSKLTKQNNFLSACYLLTATKNEISLPLFLVSLCVQRSRKVSKPVKHTYFNIHLIGIAEVKKMLRMKRKNDSTKQIFVDFMHSIATSMSYGDA